MRKSFITYLVIWLICLGLFNAFVFLIPSTINGKTICELVKIATLVKSGSASSLDAAIFETNNLVLDKFAGSFWVGYIFITITFIGQLICSCFALSERNSQKFFYKVPLITVSFSCLIVTLIVGFLTMFIPNLPIWLGVLICLIVFVFSAISILKANLVSTIISNKDDEITDKTAFIKEMTAKAKALWDQDKQNEDLRKLYETFRYSNPYIQDGDNRISNLMNNIDSSNVKTKVKEVIKELTRKNEQ